MRVTCGTIELSAVTLSDYFRSFELTFLIEHRNVAKYLKGRSKNFQKSQAGGL